jgi:hypothetical protein
VPSILGRGTIGGIPSVYGNGVRKKCGYTGFFPNFWMGHECMYEILLCRSELGKNAVIPGFFLTGGNHLLGQVNLLGELHWERALEPPEAHVRSELGRIPV